MGGCFMKNAKEGFDSLTKSSRNLFQVLQTAPVYRVIFWTVFSATMLTEVIAERLAAQGEEVVAAEKIDPVLNAYAENDYYQKRPLMDALELGFRMIEADTFLADDQLLVGHSVLDLQTKGSLESLYFAPIEKLVSDRSELASAPNKPLWLIIDVKSDADLTYRALRKLLSKYSAMLTKVVDGNVERGAVTVIISGNTARTLIEKENPRYVAIDGRFPDLDSESPTHLIPMVSARWGSHFRWLGKSEFTKYEESRLKSIVDQAHAQKRLIRFWSTPDVKAVWTKLRTAEVDLIGAGRYALLTEFLVPRKSPFAP